MFSISMPRYKSNRNELVRVFFEALGSPLCDHCAVFGLQAFFETAFSRFCIARNYVFSLSDVYIWDNAIRGSSTFLRLQLSLTEGLENRFINQNEASQKENVNQKPSIHYASEGFALLEH